MKAPAVEAHVTLTADGKLAAADASAWASVHWRLGDAFLTGARRKPPARAPLVLCCGRTGALRGRLDRFAADHGVRRFLCGPEPLLLKALVEHGLLSRLHVTILPVIAGGAGRPTLLGPAASGVLPHSVALELERFTGGGERARAIYRVRGAKN